jgi:hypothetical protein
MGLFNTILDVEKILYIVLAGVLVLFFIQVGQLQADDATTVTTRVNITQALPIIQNITVNSGLPINLTEGSVYPLLCNVTVVDYNNLSDIDFVNGTFFRTNVSLMGAEDNNTRYLNTNCSYNHTVEPFTFAYYCWFNVTYHAFNGSWNCTAFTNNTLNNPQNGSNSSEIIPLYAMNITDVVDYGDLAIFDTSTVRSVNVTNWGNRPINLTIYAYGGSDNATGGGLSFVCPNGFSTNISVDNQRWTLEGDVPWSTMIPFTSGPVNVDNVTIQKQTTDANVWNTTHLKLYVPPNPFGACNGTIVYEAFNGGYTG